MRMICHVYTVAACRFTMSAKRGRTTSAFLMSETAQLKLSVLRLKALSHLDDLASVCPTYENLANTLTYVE